MNMDAIPRTRPRLWPYLVGLLLLIPTWIAFVELVMRPKALSLPGTPMGLRLPWYLLAPLVLVGGYYLAHLAVLRVRAHKAEGAQQSQQKAEDEREKAAAAALRADQDHAHYTLEVYALGLSLDRFRDDQVWAKLQELPESASILPEIPKTDPDYNDDRSLIKKKRGTDAYVKALGSFVEEWEVPFIGVMATNHSVRYKNITKDLVKNTVENNRIQASPYLRVEVLEQVYDDAPDRVLAKVFETFDKNPEMPALALYVEDGLASRGLLRPDDEKHPASLEGARKPGEMTESMVCVVFARRDRVEILRSSATDQTIPKYLIPVPGSATYEADLAKEKAGLNAPAHDPMRPFWEKGDPTAAFKPNAWVRRPWCKEQLAQFDMLKLLGRVHRPQIVSYLHNGKPLPPTGQQKAFNQAWKAALDSLPQGQLPKRVIFDHGKSSEGRRMAPLVHAMHELGPDVDLPGKHGVNLTTRVGDTGASSAFVALALGITASRKDGGPTACVNLRRNDGASIIMITPPTPEDLVPHKIHLKSKYLGTSGSE
jgi:hypothetical protein